MKKIGIVTTWFERGAAYVSKQFKEVWEEENEVYIYARGGEEVALNDPKWQTENIAYGRRYSYTNLDLINLNHFKKWIESNNLDIVFFNEQHIWDPILLCKKMGITIGSYIDYYTHQTVPLFDIFDFLICNTKRHHSVFNWHPQVFYIPWGTDQNIFNGSQKKQTKLSEVVFFHSAGMNPYRKGTDFLIKAFSQIKSEKAKLIIHSQVNIFTFFPKMKTICDDLFNKKRIEIIIKTISAPGLYHIGDVYVYPTRLEGIGLSIAEANSCGMPVITTNQAPMNEFIIDGNNGSLIKVKSSKKRKDNYFWNESYIDVGHLTKIMQEYILNYKELEDRKRKALTYSQNNFNWNKNSLILLSIVREIRKRPKTMEIIEKVKSYEKTRGIRFYLANLVFYDKIKKKVKNILNKS
jgi:1,2-diacylglycerol 3-alpha-glucosyltransferase